MIAMHRRLCGVTLAGGLALGGGVAAQAQSAPADQARIWEALRRLEGVVAAQERTIADQQRALERQRRELDLLRAQAEQAGGEGERAATARALKASYSHVVDRAEPPTRRVAQAGAPAARSGEEIPSAARTDPQTTVYVPDVGGVLTPQGTLLLEPSLEFTRSTVTRVEVSGFTVFPAINIGQFSIDEADRNTVSAILTARYGLTNRLEAEVRAPYVYRDDRVSTRPVGVGAQANVETELSDSDIGDVEFAGRYQLNAGLGGWPIFIGELRLKSRTGVDPFEVERNANGVELELPTGTGFWSVSPGLTFLLPSDPAVFYGGVSYGYTIERDVGGGFGEVDAGDILGFTLGMGLALNERSSFTMGVEYNVVGKTEQNGQTVPGSDVLHIGRMSFGYTYRIADNAAVNFSVQPGFTDDSPDVQFAFRVPISFDLGD